MGKRTFEGQLNMFDYFRGNDLEFEEVQMVSLMPEDLKEEDVPKEEKTPVVEETPNEEVNPKEEEDASEELGEVYVEERKTEDAKKNGWVMHRTYKCAKGEAIIAYLDYHKVYVKDVNQKEQTYSFQNAKEAVDFYVEKMQMYEK
ncbi:MAG: hypothetical protein UIC64_07625 [Agathobacter sp.]|nr:hypothetical protein [Agathobacter sp.]